MTEQIKPKERLTAEDELSIRQSLEMMLKLPIKGKDGIFVLTSFSFLMQTVERACGLPSNITDEDTRWAKKTLKELRSRDDYSH